MHRCFALTLLCISLSSSGCSSRTGRTPQRTDLPQAIHRNNLGVSLMDRGMAMNDRIYFGKAVKEFEAAVRLAPDRAVLHTNLARALYFAAEPAQPEAGQQFHDRAHEHLRTALQLDSKHAGAYFMQGLLAKHANQERETLTAFQKAAAHEPGDWSCHYQVGATLFRQGKFNQAETALRKAVELNPGSREAAYQLFMTLHRQGKPEHAKQVDFQRLPEPAQGEPNYFYLRPGRLTETVALKPEAKVSESKLVFVDATKQFNLNFKHGGFGHDPEVAKALKGEPLPRAWFIKNKLKLVSAIGSGVAAGDFDGDGWCDVFLPNCNGKNALLRNDQGKFVDVTATAGVGGRGELAMAAVWGDYDNDGKLDLLVTHYGGATLYRNQGGGRFADVSKPVGLNAIPRGTWCTGAAFADVDHDADLDFYICGYADLGRIPNQPLLRFPRDFAGSRNFLFRNNTLDKTKPKMPGYGAKTLFTEVAKEAKVTGDKRKALGVLFGDFNEDNAVDFYVVNDSTPNELFWNLRDRTFAEIARAADAASGQLVAGVIGTDFHPPDGFADVLLLDRRGTYVRLGNRRARGQPYFSREAGLVGNQLVPKHLAVTQAVADFNNDNVPDRIETHNGALAVLKLGKPAPNSHWIKVRAHARALGESPQSNRSSIGAKIEVVAPGRWQKQEIRAGGGYLSCDSFDLCFDLGTATTIEFVRGLWPSGIRGSVAGAKAGTVVKLEEPAGIPPSCPYVYVWNGRRFEFLADTLAGGTLGELISPTDYLPLDPDEWLQVDGDRLAPRDGAYEVRLVNQNPETDFVDQARLLAIDHPADTEIFPNERMTGPPFPPFKVWSVRDARPPVAAFDDAGRNVLDRIRNVDRVYHTEPRPLPWRGFAQPHSLTVDLGPFPPSPRPSVPASPVLLLNGFIDWGGSSTALGAGQGGVLYAPPKLEVIGPDGRWRTAIADMGYPAGRARTIVVPLSGLFPTGDHRLRITTNMTIYWDQVRVAFADPAPLTIHHSPLTQAKLQWCGYPRAESTDGKQPPIPDYEQRDPFRDYPTHAGAFTRYGAVLPLVQSIDDDYVIMNHGDELQLRFEAKLSPLRVGWKRDFLLYFFGYGKSTDVNTASSLTVEPLPFRAMSGYPYAATERYPFAQHALRWMQFQTRPGYERVH